jgi:hypothetical protein
MPPLLTPADITAFMHLCKASLSPFTLIRLIPDQRCRSPTFLKNRLNQPNNPKTPHQTHQTPILGIDFAPILCYKGLRCFFIGEQAEWLKALVLKVLDAPKSLINQGFRRCLTSAFCFLEAI